MKSKIKIYLGIILGIAFCFFSCQDEVVDITPIDEQEVITSGSNLSSLMSSASANNGEADNVLDNSSCFSVELPVTITIGDITFIVEDLDDLEELADLLDDFDGDDLFDFVFPITLVFNDYTEIVIENEDQLDDFVDQCVDDDADDVIECVDFVYPISFSVFNQDFILIDTIVVENDEGLYDFLDSLDDENDGLIVSLNYPVTLIYANGETVEVNSNNELAEAIEVVSDDCGVYDDDDDTCDEEILAANLTECLWEIDDAINDFDDFYIDFKTDGTVQILIGDTTQFVHGNWELVDSDEGQIIRLSNLTEFQQDLEGDWLIIDCDDDELEIVKGDLVFELEKECDNASLCDPAELAENLLLCQWDLDTYTSFPAFEGLYIEFAEDGTYVLNDSGAATDVSGTWGVIVNGAGTVLSLTSNSSDFGGDWILIECDNDDDDYEYVFMNGNQMMVIEKDCDNGNNDGLFECFEEASDEDLEICDDGTDGPYEVDLTSVFANCQADNVNFFETEQDAVNFVNPIANPATYSVINTETTVYARVEIANEFEIFDIDIYIEDCDQNTCTEEAIEDYLQTCTWYVESFNGDDNLDGYTLIFNGNTLTVEGNGEVYTTTYSVEGTNPTFIFIDGFANTPLDDLSGDWTVIDCEPDDLVLQRNNDIFNLDQDCE